jgi:hypothetical protein
MLNSIPELCLSVDCLPRDIVISSFSIRIPYMTREEELWQGRHIYTLSVVESNDSITTNSYPQTSSWDS